MKARRLLLAVAVSHGLGACAGGLENPDLTTGAVAGTVANVAVTSGVTNSYVYVLGAPDLTAPIAADGSFSLRELPVGDQELVVVAGHEGGGVSVRKAAIVPIRVQGATRAQTRQDAALMPAAGRVVAAVRPPAGAAVQSATFTVLRTRHRGQAGSAGGLVLDDLPAGTWNVTASLPGYRAALPVAAAVPEGASVQIEFGLEVEIEDEQHRGCLSTGCENGLHCDPADGKCYGCVDLSHCDSADVACDPVSRTCVEGTEANGELCETAESPSKCPGSVWVQTQASPPLGYCSRACPGGTDDECPAGWACSAAAVCTVVQSCSATRATFGSPCAYDSTCHPFLARDACVRGDDDHPGYCSAACATDKNCLDAGLSDSWTCKPLPEQPPGSQGYCQRRDD